MLAEVRPGRCQLYLEFRDREHENKGRKGEESDPGQQLGCSQWVFRSLTRGGRRQKSRARPWPEDSNPNEIAGRANETGSASCRERVCEDVELKGVDET